MNTQQQAYIEGFVKRASEYGLNRNEAIDLLKHSFDMGTISEKAKQLYDTGKNKLSDLASQGIGALESKGYNTAVEGLTDVMGIPHHIADYGMKTLNSNDLTEGVKNVFSNKYNSDVFAADHPLLSRASEFLKSHNVDPTMAAAGAGGAALLGGGYMLGKHLNKKKPQPQYQIEE